MFKSKYILVDRKFRKEKYGIFDPSLLSVSLKNYNDKTEISKERKNAESSIRNDMVKPNL